MVDLLAKKAAGFRFDRLAEVEAQKGELAEERGIALRTSDEPVWKPNDPRWLMRPPYGFVPFVTRFGGPCVYCGEKVGIGVWALYSKRLASIAHNECHAGFDREVPTGGVLPDEASGIVSRFDRLRAK